MERAQTLEFADARPESAAPRQKILERAPKGLRTAVLILAPIFGSGLKCAAPALVARQKIVVV